MIWAVSSPGWAHEPVSGQREDSTVDSARDALPKVRLYGIVRPGIGVMSGVETFGRATMAAPTAAAHPIANPGAGAPVLSFQAQQTRLGVRVGDGAPLAGALEVDFIDPTFGLSSPIQTTRPRLRLASITFEPGAGHRLVIGQDWTIFSPLNPAQNNLVGAAFQAGNSGFLRPQLTYVRTWGRVEAAASVGMQRQNTGPAFDALELGLLPTGEGRLSYRVRDQLWVGVSAIGSAELTQLPPARAYVPTFAGNVFVQATPAPGLTLQAEAYAGQNTGALGLLTLGSGVEVQDAGAWVSAALSWARGHELWLSAGGAAVLDPEALSVGYTPAADVVDAGGDVVGTTPAARTGAGGIERNVTARVSYLFSPTEGLRFFVEPFVFATRHKLLPSDAPVGGDRLSGGMEVGARYDF